MKPSLRFTALVFLAAAIGFAQEVPLEELIRDQQIHERRAGLEVKRPEFDPKRIINESSGFLKEREPEMTAEEYAIYERTLTMLSTRPEFALRLLEAMISEKEPPSPAFEFILGNTYYSAGNNEKAEVSYNNAVKRYPTFLRAWSNLGVLYYATQKYPDAVRCFARCIALGDRDPMTFGLMAYSLEQEQQVVQAEMAYMQALAGDPTNPDWLEGLLRIYIEGKQYGRAEWLIKDLIKQRPKETRFWLAHANILIAQNRRLEAIALLEVSLGAGVAGQSEIMLLADLYADQKLVPEAIAAYQRVMVATPALGERKMLTLASLQLATGNLAQAQKVLDSLGNKVSPVGRSSYLLSRAELQAAQNKWPEARATLEELLKTEPLNGQALLSLGRVYLGEGNLPRAQFAFESAYQVPDSLYRACLELATLELKNRHFSKTVEYLEKALSIQKTAPVQDFLARVKPLVDDKS